MRRWILLGQAFVLVWFLFLLKPMGTGDAQEYLCLSQAWMDHGTPDLRPDDLVGAARVIEANGYVVDSSLAHGFFPTAGGLYFCWHFWLYPLCCVPARFLLRWSGGNELAAFQATNLVFFLAAVNVAWWGSNWPREKKLLFILLAAVSPVIWYLFWTSPEVYSWSLVMISLVRMSRQGYVSAALAAALAAMHNPPILFLAWFMVALSVADCSWRRTLLTAAAASLSFVPNLFYWYFYGHPNLIVAQGITDFSLISAKRTVEFLADLNQGMLPYAPTLVLAGAVALYQVARRRSLRGAGLFAVLLLMILFCQPNTNWNSGSAGMIRYGVWLTPVFAWLAAEYVPLTRLSIGLFAAGLLLQGVILAQRDHIQLRLGHLFQSPVAAFVLEHWPALYNPDPQIFAERQLHHERDFHTYLPIAYFTADGRVTKLLVDPASLRRLADKFVVDPAYAAEVQVKYAAKQGLFYLNPPAGAVTAPPEADWPTASDLNASLQFQVRFSRGPQQVPSPHIAIPVTLTNVGTVRFWPEGSGCPHPLLIAARIGPVGGDLVPAARPTRIPYAITPGETATVPVQLRLPGRQGEYRLELRPVLAGRADGEQTAVLRIRVLADDPAHYLAEISRFDEPKP